MSHMEPLRRRSHGPGSMRRVLLVSIGAIGVAICAGGLASCTGGETTAPPQGGCGIACLPPGELGLPSRVPMSTFDYPHDANARLDALAKPRVSASYEVTPVRYASADGGWVSGVLGVPRTGGRHPAIIFMHGLPGSAESIFEGHALPLVERGAIALAIDAPWARRGALPDFTPRDSTDQVQLIHDLRRAVDVLQARPDVDPERIGYMGGSYGGAIGALFVATEKRLAAAVLWVGTGGLVARWLDSTMTPTGLLAAIDPEARRRWLAAMWPIEPIRFVGASSPTPLLLQNGRADQLVASHAAAALHRAAGEPKTIEWYDAGHGLTPEAKRSREDWIARRLGF